jgi:hypothetical protein
MRRLLLLAAVAALGFGNTGCLMNRYSGDPNVRMDQLMNESEDLRQAGKEWRRFWMNDTPSHLTPERIDGAIEPP